MFKSVTAAGLVVAASLMVSAPAQAEPETRILRIPIGLCDDFKRSLIKWAAITRGHAAYAVPRVRLGSGFNCNNLGPSVPTAFSFGFDTQPPADELALEECNKTVPDGFRSCSVVGRAFPISKR